MAWSLGSSSHAVHILYVPAVNKCRLRIRAENKTDLSYLLVYVHGGFCRTNSNQYTYMLCL